MGVRFETNYQRFTNAAPFPPDDTSHIQRWIRVQEWVVDTGFTGDLLMVLLSVEDQWAPNATLDYGWVRLYYKLSNIWSQCWESKMRGAAMTAKCFIPRLVIIPCGDGIRFTAGQGLKTDALGGAAAAYRWWSCYVIDTNEV